MNILFVNYHTFQSNSALHQFQLANHLVHHGMHTAVCVTRNAGAAAELGTPLFTACTYRDALAGRVLYPDGRGPDLVHAWTPREGVRRLTRRLAGKGIPYVVHLEDNEEAILEHRFDRPLDAVEAWPDWWLTLRVGRYLSHPRRARDFLRGAAGVTVIVDTLRDFVPGNVPTEVIWPAVETSLMQAGESRTDLRASYGFADRDFVVYYPGNLTRAHETDVTALYFAIARLNEGGVPARLLRTGLVDELSLVTRHGLPWEWYVDAGFQPRRRVGAFLAAADALVQPGRDNPFNHYRFPAKLPEFLASGRPVVLPRTNIGRLLEDDVNALLLNDGTAEEIAGALQRLHADPALAARIGDAGKRFAAEHFDWSRSAGRLAEFYHERLTNRGNPG